jgi:hypothetical protein
MKHVLIVTCLLASITFAYGQLPGPNGGPQSPAVQAQPQAAGCSDYQRNPNGTWSPKRPITISNGQQTAQIGPGAIIAPGGDYAGINLWEQLNAQCAQH